MSRGLLSGSVCFLIIFSCGEGPSPSSSGFELADPAYDAWSVHDDSGVLIDAGMTPVPTTKPAGLTHLRSRLSLQEVRSIEPGLMQIMEGVPADEILEVVLAVHSAHKLSFLPRYDRSRDPDSPYNAEIAEQRRLIQLADDQLRSLERSPVVEAIENLGGEVAEQFRVGNALMARLTNKALDQILDAFPQVIAASRSASEETPPTYYDIDDGRDRQDSDPVESAGYDADGYRIGLLDTGVYTAHNVFNNPDNILLWRDCVFTVYSDCTKYYSYPWSVWYNPNDPVASGGHGTAMADIIMGNDNLGDAYRGVAPEAYLDSTNVYTGLDHGTLDQTGVLRAFNLLDGYDDVIVANIAASQSHNGTISLAADDLYDEGVVVIAPVGNDSSDESQSPANAHKVLGVGAYYTSTGADYPGSQGIDGDSRYKPDVTAPTRVRAAANTGTSNVVERSGTCAAAAFAGGAAALLRDYYDYRGWSSDPGAIYAAMVTFGDEGGSSLGGADGAGNLEIGEVSSATWVSGVRYLDPSDQSYIYFNVPSNACDLRAGLWFAEDYDDSHSAIFLYLYQGSTLRASSTHYNSVFQKVMHAGSMGSGTWHLRMYSSWLNSKDDLKVHYLIHYRTNC